MSFLQRIFGKKKGNTIPAVQPSEPQVNPYISKLQSLDIYHNIDMPNILKETSGNVEKHDLTCDTASAAANLQSWLSRNAGATVKESNLEISCSKGSKYQTLVRIFKIAEDQYYLVFGSCEWD